MKNTKVKQTANQVKEQKAKLLNETDLSLQKILYSNKCQIVIQESREYRDCFFTPTKTLHTFIKQVLNPDKSCRNAIAGLIPEQHTNDKKFSSKSTGNYTKARQKLPEKMVKALVKETSSKVELSMPPKWHWKGYHIKVADGTTLSMPDTKENQSSYPQHKKQAQGCGFPLARMVAIMSLASGAVLDYSIGAYKGKGTGEQSLLREILSSCIGENDILLGDKYYPSYFLLHSLKSLGAEGVFQAQGQRSYDFRKGQKLGVREHIIEWRRPAKPAWMDLETYQCIPEIMRVREFKVNGTVYVTTLLKHKKHNKKELLELYKMRWQVELNLKSIKAILGMDILSCKTPAMIKREIAVHMLAYNIIRIIMAEAAVRHDVNPLHLSFKGALQLLNNFMPNFFILPKDICRKLFLELLKCITENQVGNRPGRVEPRVVKRRQKPYQRMQQPREILRKKLVKKSNQRLNAAA